MTNRIHKYSLSTVLAGTKTSVLFCLIAAYAFVPEASAENAEVEPLIQLEAFEVRSPTFARLVDDFAQPVRVIDAEALSQLRQSSIGETLAGLPGVLQPTIFPVRPVRSFEAFPMTVSVSLPTASIPWMPPSAAATMRLRSNRT